MKHLYKTLILSGLLFIGGAVESFAENIPTSAGSTLSSGKKYEVTTDVTIDRTAGKNGLVVESGATVTIDIAEGKTLTVYGANGSGLTAGKAGILLPSGSTLNVTGKGTLKVYGGNAGNGANGTNGGSSFVNAERSGDRIIMYIKSISGVGGNGGGGAGAAIGSDGGDGGTRTESHTEYQTDLFSDSDAKGPWSCGGSHSQVSTPGASSVEYGTLNIEPSVNAILVGGQAGCSGKMGKKGYLYQGYNSYYIYAATGGAGGGGGAGGAGADYGRGGNGGSTGSKGTCGQIARSTTPAEGANGANGANGTSFYTGSSSSASSAITLTNGQTLNITDNATYYEAGKSGITIASGATATINIAKGKTLTVYGAPGKAGINLPSDATLYIKGLGTLKVYGGAAYNGDNGENSIAMVDNYYYNATDRYYRVYLLSRAGYGGNGGSGAGAAIGTDGGNGAAREEGTRDYKDYCDSNSSTIASWSGPDYARNSNSGAAASSCGSLHIEKTTNVLLLGGIAGDKGNVGLFSNTSLTVMGSYVYYVSPGGYGGAGGAGGAGAEFGKGGNGGNSGQKGGTGKDSRNILLNQTGNVGNDGNVGAVGTASTYTLDDVTIKVTLDAQGGSCASSVDVTYLGTYASLPAPTRSGFAFAGWYTEAGKGTKVETTSTVVNKENHTLYAHWMLSIEITEQGSATVFSDKNLVVPAGVEVYGFTYADGVLVQGEKISEGAILPANNGYLVKASVASTYNFAPTDAAATATASVLTGTTAEINTPSGDVYVWGKPDGYNYGWYKYSDAKIPACKAYYIKQQ